MPGGRVAERSSWRRQRYCAGGWPGCLSPCLPCLLPDTCGRDHLCQCHSHLPPRCFGQFAPPPPPCVCLRPIAHWRQFKIRQQASAPSVGAGRATDACYKVCNRTLVTHTHEHTHTQTRFPGSWRSMQSYILAYSKLSAERILPVRPL